MLGLFDEADYKCMRVALSLARRAARKGEVPVGALVVSESGQLLAAEHNRSIMACDPTAHAEMLALRKAAADIGNYRLIGVTLFVTLEPCSMCMGALIWARVKRVVFGAKDSKNSNSLDSLIKEKYLKKINHSPLLQGGLLAEESTNLLKAFFATKR